MRFDKTFWSNTWSNILHNNEDKLVHVVFKLTVVWLSKTVCLLSSSSVWFFQTCDQTLLIDLQYYKVCDWPSSTRAEHWWTWPTGPRPLSTLTGPQLHQEPPDVSVVMRCWDLWQMNKSNLSVADRGAIDLSGVRATLLLMTLFPVDTHLTSDPAWEINEFDLDGLGRQPVGQDVIAVKDLRSADLNAACLYTQMVSVRVFWVLMILRCWWN